MRVLVLDTATKTGWCLLADGVIVKHGLLRLDMGISAKGSDEKHPLIMAAAYNQFARLCREHRPDFIVAEIPHLRGASSFVTVGIYSMAQLVSYQTSAGFYGVHTAQWQSRVIPGPNKPKGATKQRSIAFARNAGFDVETDDVADAICIATYVTQYLEIAGQRIAA